MKSGQRLTKSEQFTRVYNAGISRSDRFLVLKAMPNQLDVSRFGISVSKRVGGAVVRNRVKRLIREILRLHKVDPGWDIVLIARSPAAGSNYLQLQNSIISLFSRAKIGVI